MKIRNILPVPFSLLCLVHLAGSPAAAQEGVPGLDAGDRVRVVSPTPGEGRVMGSVVEVAPGWFAFSLEEEPSQVWTRRFQFVDTLVVGQGRDRGASAWRGALWGAFVGGSMGGIAGPFTGRSIDRGAWELVGMFGGAGAVVGAGVGALIGALIAPEQWQPFVFMRER